MLNEPRSIVFIRLGPTPKHIWRYHTEIFDCGTEIVRARTGDTLL